MKVLKIYLKNCPGSRGTQIYCIKHEVSEDLTSLKEKIYIRCPQLRVSDPIIYWYDLELDKIRVTCDDDLRFFMEDSEICKLNFEFSSQESRKRRSSHEDDDDNSKRLRKDMQKIELSPESSSMETETDSEIENVEQAVSVTSTNNKNDDPIPSTSQNMTESEPANINIINVEIIKNPAQEIVSDNDNEVNRVNEEAKSIDSGNSSAISNEHKQLRERSNSEPSNRIVISDSSDDDDEERETRNRNQNDFRNYHENRNRARYSGSYSFSFSGERPSFNQNFNQQMGTEFMRIQREGHRFMTNMKNMQRNMANNQRHIRSQILSNFQQHFSPLYGQGNNYHH